MTENVEQGDSPEMQIVIDATYAAGDKGRIRARIAETVSPAPYSGSRRRHPASVGRSSRIMPAIFVWQGVLRFEAVSTWRQ